MAAVLLVTAAREEKPENLGEYFLEGSSPSIEEENYFKVHKEPLDAYFLVFKLVLNCFSTEIIQPNEPSKAMLIDKFGMMQGCLNRIQNLSNFNLCSVVAKKISIFHVIIK